MESCLRGRVEQMQNRSRILRNTANTDINQYKKIWPLFGNTEVNIVYWQHNLTIKQTTAQMTQLCMTRAKGRIDSTIPRFHDSTIPRFHDSVGSDKQQTDVYIGYGLCMRKPA
jgi:hypothetical protein